MQKPVNKNASKEAAELLRYLEKTAGHGIMTAYADESDGGDFLYQRGNRKDTEASRL